LLGYYIASLIPSIQSLSLEQKILFIATFGSFVGTLLYYVKPIERAISFYFILSKKNETTPDEPYGDELSFIIHKSEILYSSFLQDERTKINGAFFFAFGILTSYGLLQQLGASQLYLWIQIFTAMLLVIGFHEIYLLIKRKMPIVVFYYNYYNISKNIPLLEEAIKRKDWVLADKIREKEPELVDPVFYYNYFGTPGSEVPKMGICLKCQKIMEGSYCTECGEKLKKKCHKCKNRLVENGVTIPKYCRYCGEEIVTNKKA